MMLAGVFYTSYSQSLLQDVVYLKDGSIYRGIIKEQNDEAAKIEIAGGSLIVISRDKINYITSETVVTSDGMIFQQRRSGYFNITTLGIPVGTRDPYDYYYTGTNEITVGFSAQSIHGYRFCSSFLAGAGLGLDIIAHPMMRMFTEFRYEPLKNQVTPFCYLNSGYAIDLANEPESEFQETKYKGGFAWGTGAGMRFNFRSHGALLFSVGYKSNVRSEHTFYEGSTDILEKFTSNRIAIDIGLAF